MGVFTERRVAMANVPKGQSCANCAKSTKDCKLKKWARWCINYEQKTKPKGNWS